MCKRCAANGIQCVFEKASDRNRTRNGSVATEGFGGEAEGQVGLAPIQSLTANAQSRIASGKHRPLPRLGPESDPNGPPADLIDVTAEQRILKHPIIRPLVPLPARRRRGQHRQYFSNICISPGHLWQRLSIESFSPQHVDVSSTSTAFAAKYR